MFRSLVLTLLLMLSVSAGAQSASYDYLQGTFGRVDLDGTGLDADGDGLGISASFSLNSDFHVFGDYQTADLNFGVDVSVLELGGGYHTDISPRLSVNANVGYIEVDASAAGIGSADADGLFVGLGLRGPVSDTVELFGGLDYIDFDGDDGETRAKAGFILSLTEALGVGVEANLWDDVNIFQLHARYYFQ